MTGRPTIREAGGADDLRAIRVLFAEYAAALPIDLAFQGFAGELESLPGRYAAPSGTLLLARGADGAALGCVAVRGLEGRHAACEIKRLYLRPEARGSGAGRALAEAALAFAQAAGHREVLLDTLPSMTAATALYRALGFAPTAPYGPGGGPDLHYFRKVLGPA